MVEIAEYVDPATPVVSGDNDFRKYIMLQFEPGTFNTIQTIVIPEDEWLKLNGKDTDGRN